MIHNQPPRLPYNGLTFLLSKPSRFDTQYLISGTAGRNFDLAIHPNTRASSSIRTKYFDSPFLPGTKVLVRMGIEDNLLEIRGSPWEADGLINLSTFHPQDVMDMQDWEGKFNPYVQREEMDEGKDDEVYEGKTH